MEIINIDKHILQWAKFMHKMTEQPLEGNRGQTERLEVVYDKVKVKVADQKNPDEDTVDAVPDSNQDHHLLPGEVVFKSTFKNTSDLPQQHVFEMERETSGILNTSVKKGFCRSGKVGMTLAVPDVISNVTGGFGSVVVVKEKEEASVHHTLKWKVNSTVTVQGGQTTVATLKVSEVERKFNFTAKAILSGTVLVRIVDLTTGEFLKVVQNDIGTLLGDIQAKQQSRSTSYSDRIYDNLPAIPTDVKISPSDTKSPGSVEWPVEGELNFRFGISQIVEVSNLPKAKK